MSSHAVNIYSLLTQVKSHLCFSPGLSFDGELRRGKHGALCLKSQHKRILLVLGQPGLQKKIVSQNKKERGGEREGEKEEGKEGGKEGKKKKVERRDREENKMAKIAKRRCAGFMGEEREGGKCLGCSAFIILMQG